MGIGLVLLAVFAAVAIGLVVVLGWGSGKARGRAGQSSTPNTRVTKTGVERAPGPD